MWTIESGALNFSNILEGITNYKLAATFIILTYFQLLFATYRTRLLMNYNNDSISNHHLLKINWASSFVSSVAPFSVFGDLFRINHLINTDKSNAKDNSFYCSLLSKVFSAVGIILITGIATIFAKDIPYKIVLTVYLLFTGTIIFLVSCNFKKLYLTFLSFVDRLKILNNRTFLKNRIINLKTYTEELLSKRELLVKVFGYSVIIQILNTFSILLICYSLNPSLSIDSLQLLSVIPVGILLMMIPISFNGLGIGHFAFAKLLFIAGIQNGADIFSIFFIFTYLFNFLGVIPFVTLLDIKAVSFNIFYKKKSNAFK